MQRLWTFSDLHQEWPENHFDLVAHSPTAGFDVAVVAGDVHTPLTGALGWLASRLPGVPIVYVPGNHDFYWDRGEDRYTIYDQIERGRELAAKHGIHLLMDTAVTLGGTRFVGGTLWTDFRLGTYSWAQAAAMAAGRDGMNDYRRIRTGPTSRKRLRPAHTRDFHKATHTFIADVLTEPHDGPTVVVTHHSPHPTSLRSPYEDLNWCYASDLTDLILEGRPNLWVHGHIHHHADYLVGTTRVVANPRGHVEQSAGFISDMVIEIGGGRPEA